MKNRIKTQIKQEAQGKYLHKHKDSLKESNTNLNKGNLCRYTKTVHRMLNIYHKEIFTIFKARKYNSQIVWLTSLCNK